MYVQKTGYTSHHTNSKRGPSRKCCHVHAAVTMYITNRLKIRGIHGDMNARSTYIYNIFGTNI